MENGLGDQVKRQSGVHVDFLTLERAITNAEMHQVQRGLQIEFSSRWSVRGGPDQITRHHLFGKWHGPVWDRLLLWNHQVEHVQQFLMDWGIDCVRRQLVQTGRSLGLSRLNRFSQELVEAQLYARFPDHDPLTSLTESLMGAHV